MASRLRRPVPPTISQLVGEITSIIEVQGTTIEGYMKTFKPENERDEERVRLLHAANHEILNTLLNAGLLEAAGHPTEETIAWILMHRQVWLRQLTTKNIKHLMSSTTGDHLMKGD